MEPGSLLAHTNAVAPISEIWGRVTGRTGVTDASREAGVTGVSGPGVGLEETDIGMEFLVEGVWKVSHLNSQSINRL